MISNRQAAALRFLQAGMVVLGAGWVYAPSLRGGWLWDDQGEIAGNLDLRRAAGLGNLWFHPATPDYFPLKSTVQWVQWHLWHGNVAGYHLTNVGLHVLSAFLLWGVLRRLGAACAWLGGMIFAVHPVAVESVAWISELKNTLSLPLMLLALIFWIDGDAASPGRVRPVGRLRAGGKPLPGKYLLSLSCFLAAMLCKSSVAMFPAVLLLHAWWRRGRVGRRDLAASAPFFAVSLILGLVAISFQFHRAFGGEPVPELGFPPRLAAAGLAIGFYFWKCVLPTGLLLVYPRWNVEPPSALQFLPWVGIAAVTAGLLLTSSPALSGRQKLARNLILGLGFFLINLVPVLGFAPMAYQRISWVADHFAYISLAAIAGLAAAGFGAVWKAARSGRAPAGILAAMVIAALAWQARAHAALFRSEKALWSATAQRNPDSWLAQDNLGNAIRNEGRPADAIPAYERALRLRPGEAEAHADLGAALADAGRLPAALAQFGLALRINPDAATVHDRMGNALAANGRAAAAAAEYREALRLDPGSAPAHYDLGLVFARAGRPGEAIPELERAVELNPDYVEAQNNLANALCQAGRYAEAIPHFQRALRLEPANAVAHYNFGLALRALGRSGEARAQWQEAARLSRP